MVYAFIDQACSDLPIEQCCKVMKVSRSAFYAWRRRQANPTAKMADDIELAELIVKIHDQSHGTYWRPRVTAELRLGLGRQVNHKRVQRLMRVHGVQGITRRRRTKGCTRSRAGDPRNDDLAKRQFRPDRPNRFWVQDITQHHTREGWVYMAVVIDAWSRRVGQRLRHAGLMGSMGTVGDALDNAVAESFLASLHCECWIDTNGTLAELARAMFHYIEAFYNPTRRHSTLGYLSPVDFETSTAPAA